MLRPPALLLLLAVAGCRPDYSPDVYSGSAVQQAAKVEQGVVVGVRTVGVAAQGATGAVAGAAAGGAIGSQVPANGGVAAALGAVGGSLIGGLIGTTAERAGGDTTAFEYIVRKTNGELLSVTQKDATALAVGTHVLVIAGNQARIVPDYTVPVDSPRDAAPAPSPAPVVAPAPTNLAPPGHATLPEEG